MHLADAFIQIDIEFKDYNLTVYAGIEPMISAHALQFELKGIERAISSQWTLFTFPGLSEAEGIIVG